MRTFVTAVLFLSTTFLLAQDTGPSHAFDYDPKEPLDIQEAGVEHRGSVAIHDISYASPKVGRVPAYLVVPEGKGPFAAVLWGHWYWQNSAFFNRKEFLEEAVTLAHTGVVSLLPTGVGARPGHVDDPDELSDQQVADLVHQIMDMRRGADLLLARKDVDLQRLAYVGHSYNATVGAFLSGMDKRFKEFVLMAGGLSDELDMKTQEYKQFRQKYGPEKFDEKIAKRAWLDPGKFVSHAAPPAPAGRTTDLVPSALGRRGEEDPAQGRLPRRLLHRALRPSAALLAEGAARLGRGPLRRMTGVPLRTAARA